MSDNGIGLDEAFKEKVFLPFQRIDGSKVKGTGIGLAICKKIVAGVTEFVGERWKIIPFPIDFSKPPLVFSQIVTQTDAAPAITQIQNVSKALINYGIKEREHIAIFSQNMPEWVISDLAIMGIRAITVPIYATNSKKETETGL